MREQKNKKISAILYMITSSLFFTTMNLFGKLSFGISAYQKAFTANITALIVMSAIILKTKTSFIGKKENRKYLIIRGVSGSISLLLSYYAIEKLVLPDATMLLKLGPVFATIFAFFILKEKISKKQISFLVITFIGVLFIIKPSFSFKLVPSISGILAAACAGIAFTMIRRIGHSEKSYTIIFYNLIFGCLMNIPFMFLNKENYLNRIPFVFMFFGGLCITFGQIFLTLAFKNAPAASISMFDYAGLILSAFYGFFIFHEIPDMWSIIGYVLIIFTAVISFFDAKKSID